MVLVPFLCATLQQQPVQPKRISPGVVSDSRPVTCSEAYTVFEETRSILNKRLGSSLPTCPMAQSSHPVTREQVVSEFVSIRRGLDSKIRFSLPPEKFDKSVLRIAAKERKDLEQLIQEGYVGRVGPLATSMSDSLTVKQFGQALGLFLTRTAEVTHLPTAKWSPILGAGSR